MEQKGKNHRTILGNTMKTVATLMMLQSMAQAGYDVHCIDGHIDQDGVINIDGDCDRSRQNNENGRDILANGCSQGQVAIDTDSTNVKYSSCQASDGLSLRLGSGERSMFNLL